MRVRVRVFRGMFLVLNVRLSKPTENRRLCMIWIGWWHFCSNLTLTLINLTTIVCSIASSGNGYNKIDDYSWSAATNPNKPPVGILMYSMKPVGIKTKTKVWKQSKYSRYVSNASLLVFDCCSRKSSSSIFQFVMQVLSSSWFELWGYNPVIGLWSSSSSS